MSHNSASRRLASAVLGLSLLSGASAATAAPALADEAGRSTVATYEKPDKGDKKDEKKVKKCVLKRAGKSHVWKVKVVYKDVAKVYTFDDHKPGDFGKHGQKKASEKNHKDAMKFFKKVCDLDHDKKGGYDRH